jgi:general secretion pathway protein I
MTAESQRGFTLVEVLVALAIIAFGLVAVFGQMSQSATAANRLREKTLAEWVALNQLAELRLSGVYPPVGTRSGDVEMANSAWHYEMKVEDREFSRLVEVRVSYTADTQRPLALVSGAVARPAGGGTDVVSGGRRNLIAWPRAGSDGELPPEFLAESGTGAGDGRSPTAEIPSGETGNGSPPPSGNDDAGAVQ